jgi:Zn-dependent protease/CBS domain-containing protein
MAETARHDGSPAATARSRGAKRGLALFRLAGIQVRVDPSWLLIFVLIWWSLSAGYFPRAHPGTSGAWLWTAGLLSALLFFVSLLLHELAHSVVARRAGLEVSSITLFLFGGASEMTREPDDPRTEFRIAIVGPLTSFALAGLFWLLGVAVAGAAPDLLLGVVRYLVWINVALGVFNLLPGFPLDGGRVLRALVWWRTGSLRRASDVATRAGQGLGIGLAILGTLQIFSGALVGGVWLILIGLFLRGLAAASHRSLLLRQLLSDVTVEDVMVRDPVSVPADLSIEQLVEDYILGRGFRGFPVMDGERPIGLVSLETVKSVPAERRALARVRDHLEPLDEASVVAPDTSLTEALEKLGRSGRQRMLVMRPGSNRLAGLMTRTGLARFVEIRQALTSAERG